MKNKIKIYLLKVILLTFICNIGYSLENKIIFKINNKAFTTIDYDFRIQYLDFVGNNQSLDKEIVLNDFISANLFYENFIARKDYNIKEIEKKIEEIYNNIFEINKKNKKIYKYEINKKNILRNIKIDYYRKIILEQTLNTNINNFNISIKDIDLLYDIKISYINFNDGKTKNLYNRILNLDNINFDNIQKFLKQNEINFFIKQKEIINIDKIDLRIKNNILSNNNFFVLDINNKISLIFIEKKFETFESIIVNLFSVRSESTLNDEILSCQNLLNNNNLNILSKEYKYKDLNNELKNNLVNINDYYLFNNNSENIYVVLCDIKFDKKILENLNFNKLINSNVSSIEKKLINKFSKMYNLILINA